jgi:hypothetical protein
LRAVSPTFATHEELVYCPNHNLKKSVLDPWVAITKTCSPKTKSHTDPRKIPVHIFTDSMYTQTTLCNNFIQKKHFSLIEDLKNITSFLTDDFDFFIHWIPSHIENTSAGKLPIRGNVHADRLARLALDQKEPLHKNMIVVRKEILIQSAQLITNIDKLFTNKPHIFTTGGPSDSSDGFSLTDAIRNTSLRVS